MNAGLIDDEQGRFRMGSGCVNQIFTLKQKRKTQSICRFYRFGGSVR